MSKTIVGIVPSNSETKEMGISREGLKELERSRTLVGDIHAVLSAYVATGDSRLPVVAKHLIDEVRRVR